MLSLPSGRCAPLRGGRMPRRRAIRSGRRFTPLRLPITCRRRRLSARRHSAYHAYRQGFAEDDRMLSFPVAMMAFAAGPVTA